MEISVLNNRIMLSEVCSILQQNLAKADAILNNIKLYSEGEASFSENVLYVIRNPCVIPHTKSTLNFIYIDRQESSTIDFLQDKDNYFVVSPINSDTDVLDFLINLFSEDQQLDVVLRPLIEALLKDYGLQRMSDISTQILGNPFWIIDMNFNYVTRPRTKVSDPNIQQEIELGYVLDDTVVSLRKNKTREQIQRLNEAFSFKAEGTDKHVLMAAVKIKNITVSYINAFEENELFTAFHSSLMNRIAEIIGIEMQKTSYFKSNKGLMFSYFFTDLLESKMDNMHNIQDRMNALGYKMQKYYYILAINLYSLEFREISLNTINEQIKYIIKDCIYCTYKNHAVFLISKPTAVRRNAALFKDLEQYLSESNLIGGISDPVTDIRKIRMCYEKAQCAVRLGIVFKPDSHLMQYSDLAIYHIIENSEQSIKYTDLCNGAIEKLLEHDNSYKTEFIETIICYLNHNAQIVPAAKQLNIHPNTLRYRLEKIKEITEYSLEDGKENSELLLAIRIYDYNTKKIGKRS